MLGYHQGIHDWTACITSKTLASRRSSNDPNMWKWRSGLYWGCACNVQVVFFLWLCVQFQQTGVTRHKLVTSYPLIFKEQGAPALWMITRTTVGMWVIWSCLKDIKMFLINHESVIVWIARQKNCNTELERVPSPSLPHNTVQTLSEQIMTTMQLRKAMQEKEWY